MTWFPKCSNPIGLLSPHNNNPNTAMKFQKLDINWISLTPFLLDWTNSSCGQSSPVGQTLQPFLPTHCWLPLSECVSASQRSTWSSPPGAPSLMHSNWKPRPQLREGCGSSWPQLFLSTAMFVIQFLLANKKKKCIWNFWNIYIFLIKVNCCPC